MALDAENEDLIKKVYTPLNFKRARSLQPGAAQPRLMYAPFESLIPELAKPAPGKPKVEAATVAAQPKTETVIPPRAD